MSLVSHIESLSEKHARLEGALQAETARPMPDFASIQTLKKQKLLIKEELERLTQQEKLARDDAA